MTASHHLTGSRVELADAGCLFPFRADVEWPADALGAAARLGSATHEAAATTGDAANERAVDEEDLEQVLRDAASCSWVDGEECVPIVAGKWNLSPSATEQLRDLYDTWYAWWFDWLPDGASVRYEVPFAWDTETWKARELPSTGARDYSAALPTEVTCTLDAVVAAPDGRRIVVDLKTGRRRHPSAATHAQLATGALCVANVFGVSTVDVVLAKIMPGDVYADSATLDVDTLDARALSLSRYLYALPSAQPVPGRHCSECYCPLMSTCEGPRALARTAPAAASALPIVVDTEEQAAAVLASHKTLQAYLDGLKRSAREWAERNGGRVRMADGAVMRLTPTERRTVDAAKAASHLVRHFGDDMGGLVKIKRSVSVTEVERAAAALAPVGRSRVAVEARKARVVAVLSDLESAGAIRTSQFSQWEEEKPAALLPASKGKVL